MRIPIATLTALMLAGSGVRAGTSNSLLDVSPDGQRLLVANTDNGTITVVDTTDRKAVREIAVGRQPEGVSWIGAGPLAAVTLYFEDKVALIDADAGTVVATIPVAADPYGIVASPDGRRLWVTHDHPACVSEIDPQAKAVVRTMATGPNSRGIALAPDGESLFVTEFQSTKLHRLDLASGRVTHTWAGHETDNLCRNVVLHPQRPKAYLSHIRSRTHLFTARGSIFPQLSVCDFPTPPLPNGHGSDESSPKRTSFALDTFNGVYVVASPWEAAVSADGKKLYTIYAATNDMNVSDLVDDDFRELERSGRAARTGKNPRAVRVHPAGKEVYVYNAVDYTVGVHDAKTLNSLATIKVCDPPHTPAWVRGKELFHTANPPMTRARWIACASCHPDGVSDGRVWQTGDGPRKTPHLFGVAHTHPLHWSADRDEVQDFEYTIRSKLMGGSGLMRGSLDSDALKETLAGRSSDLDALAVYTNSFDFRLSPYAAGSGRLTPTAERGKAVFFSSTTKCATCHSGPYFTDSRLEKPYNLHDVGTGDAAGEALGPKFDTPTLLGVYRMEPLLHDGRAKTLRHVLATQNRGDKHGSTSQLSATEIDDLVAFLKSLPYEPPPAETPNTVPHRLKK
jgi:YVTN family beta-propeller protein